METKLRGQAVKIAFVPFVAGETIAAFGPPSQVERCAGPVDQLEDRYLGMVEAVGSNPTRSTFLWSGHLFGPEAAL